MAVLIVLLGKGALGAARISQIKTPKGAHPRGGTSLRPDQSRTFKTGTFTYTLSHFVRCKLFVNNNVIEDTADLKLISPASRSLDSASGPSGRCYDLKRVCWSEGHPGK